MSPQVRRGSSRAAQQPLPAQQPRLAELDSRRAPGGGAPVVVTAIGDPWSLLRATDIMVVA
jgi:hypothetical protein